MPEINWHHDRSKLILRAAVMPPAGAPNETTLIEVQALLDTGATASGLTARIAKALGLTSLGKKPVQTAGGMIQTDRFAFRAGFYMAEPGSVPAFPHMLDGTIFGIGLADVNSFDVIIGMDVIGRNYLELRPDGLCTFRF
ncbi:retropepsin-like aspartic protease [Sphingomonas cavernae]|uniref:Peptidase A2 domain-containing protein n=1 Tax=Sphingomonas cavernae TaxID=2320861 RepID=A0A418WR17_9SPHN|nr:retropepsin-like aspartic protease [Sphingomonas cavernae]RJF93704.1 hypothetical protein D3876_05240 [Sphingomonas cavernae]